MENIATLRLYTRVARLGSFSAAARECGLSQSRASRLIAELETELGVRLLSRTTRAVVPTEAGLDFLSRIELLLANLSEIRDDIGDSGELRGLLRISMPTSIGVREIVPRLAAFRRRHPKLRLEVLMEDRQQDLVRDAIDVAIRVGRLRDSGATAKQIRVLRRVVSASPEYLAAMGTPAHPTDLAGHDAITGPAGRVSTAWTFHRDGETVEVAVNNVMLTNDNEGAVAAAVAGMGITSTSNWSCRRELESGSLVELLPDWATAEIPVYAYFPMGRASRRSARALIEHLEEQFAATPA